MNKKEYDIKMLEAYIGRASKFTWYTKAFKIFDTRSEDLSWYWNNWAMIGGFWYFLYRKQIKMALISLFIILIAGVILPLTLFILFYLLFSIVLGGLSTYFIYTNYKTHQTDIEAMFRSDKEKCIAVMHVVGGVNPVALYAGVFFLLSLIFILVGLLRMAQGSVLL